MWKLRHGLGSKPKVACGKWILFCLWDRGAARGHRITRLVSLFSFLQHATGIFDPAFGSEVGCESKKKRFQVSRKQAGKQASESLQRRDHLTRKHFLTAVCVVGSSSEEEGVL